MPVYVALMSLLGVWLGRQPAPRAALIYADAGEPPLPETALEGPALARALRDAGVTRLYADHGWASRAALADPGIRVPPANRFLDAYGFQGSANDLLPPFRWTPGPEFS